MHQLRGRHTLEGTRRTIAFKGPQCLSTSGRGLRVRPQPFDFCPSMAIPLRGLKGRLRSGRHPIHQLPGRRARSNPSWASGASSRRAPSGRHPIQLLCRTPGSLHSTWGVRLTAIAASAQGVNRLTPLAGGRALSTQPWAVKRATARPALRASSDRTTCETPASLNSTSGVGRAARLLCGGLCLHRLGIHPERRRSAGALTDG